jgi:hypothetical protein
VSFVGVQLSVPLVGVQLSVPFVGVQLSVPFVGVQLSVSLHQCFTVVFIYLLLLLEGQTGEAWGHSKNNGVSEIDERWIGKKWHWLCVGKWHLLCIEK